VKVNELRAVENSCRRQGGQPVVSENRGLINRTGRRPCDVAGERRRVTSAARDYIRGYILTDFLLELENIRVLKVLFSVKVQRSRNTDKPVGER
jgi:hypothetical protein